MWRGLYSKLIFGFGLFCLLPISLAAQEVHNELEERIQAEVLEIVSEDERPVTGTDTMKTVQDVRAVLKEGERAGEVVRFENDMVILEPGDDIFVFRIVNISGVEFITFADYERRPILIVLGLVFVGLMVAFAGWHGVRSLVSLFASVAAIIFILIPALLQGYDPVLASIVIAGGVMAMVLFGTHGFKPRVYIAFGGTLLAVIVTGILATVSASMMKLTGFGSDASVFLNFSTNGELDLSGLLLGSIIIGILGVLDDVSITQAAVVEELRAANRTFQFKELYERASRVGKSHLGSLVNTLALAYVGVALPLILLFALSDSELGLIVNQEVVAGELLRIIVGSIGLILAVPITTAVAAWYYQNKDIDEVEESSHCGHHHH